MSKAGHKYSAAGAGSKGIPNEGQQELLFYNDEGAPVPMRYQVAEVRKPLTSVSKICDRGNRVTFCRNGSYVQNLFTGQRTPLRREGGVYMLDLWLAPKFSNAPPFPGRS